MYSRRHAIARRVVVGEREDATVLFDQQGVGAGHGRQPEDSVSVDRRHVALARHHVGWNGEDLAVGLPGGQGCFVEQVDVARLKLGVFLDGGATHLTPALYTDRDEEGGDAAAVCRR